MAYALSLLCVLREIGRYVYSSFDKLGSVRKYCRIQRRLQASVSIVEKLLVRHLDCVQKHDLAVLHAPFPPAPEEARVARTVVE